MRNKLLRVGLFGLLCMALVVGCGKKEKPAEDVQDNQPSFEYEENVKESETEESESVGDGENMIDSETSEPVSEENREDSAEGADDSASKGQAGQSNVVANPALDELPEEKVIVEAEIRADIEAIFKEVLALTESEENLSASAKVSNAILSKTEIWIGSVTEDNCMITISYPNVVNALIQADASLAEDATDAEIDAMLEQLAQNILNGLIESSSVQLEVKLQEVDGFWTIVWTKELYDAVTGGLYSIQ